MTIKPYRWIQVLFILVSIMTCAISFYLEYHKGMQPCPLCLMQRICILLFAVICLLSLWFVKPTRMRKVVIVQGIVAIAGLYFAARQLWLQQVPGDSNGLCMPGLAMLLQYFSWIDIMHALFWGSGDCATHHWKFLGVDMPLWSAIYFAFMFVGSGLLWFNLSNNNNKDVRQHESSEL